MTSWIKNASSANYASADFSLSRLSFNSVVISSSFCWFNGYSNMRPAAANVMIAGTQLISILMPGMAPAMDEVSWPS